MDCATEFLSSKSNQLVNATRMTTTTPNRQLARSDLCQVNGVGFRYGSRSLLNAAK